jgi:hypothetical protein
MKQIPDEALTAAPTPLPTKVVQVQDNQALYERVKQGWIVIYTPVEELRTNAAGVAESPAAKNLVSHVTLHKLPRVSVRRMSETRWFISMAEPKKEKKCANKKSSTT